MKSLTRIAIFTLISLLGVAYAQDAATVPPITPPPVASVQEAQGSLPRQVEINATIPVKSGGLLASDIRLAGTVYLPVGDRIVTVAEISFKDAANLFITPTDQITAGGQAWVFLTGSVNKTRPFVFGGIAQSFFVGAPVEGVNSTQGSSGFGILIKRDSGFAAIPIFQFDTDDFQSDRTVLGKAYSARVLLFVPLGPNFNLNLAPYASREAYPAAALAGDPGYSTRYGIKIGFSRKF